MQFVLSDDRFKPSQEADTVGHLDGEARACVHFDHERAKCIIDQLNAITTNAPQLGRIRMS